MRTKTIPLIMWVSLGLLLAGLIPFLVSAYQIRASQDSLVEQVQQTHLVSVNAIADKVSTYIDSLQGLQRALGNNPNIVKDLQSELTTESLASLLLAHDEVRAVGIYRNTDDTPLLRIANQRGMGSLAGSLLAVETKKTLVPLSYNDVDYFVLSIPTNQRTLLVRLLVERSTIQDFLSISGLETADLAIIDSAQSVIEGRSDLYTTLPNEFKSMVSARAIDSAADNYVNAAGSRQVAAFAKIKQTDWSVISLQPAREAEVATRKMRSTALRALIAVLSMIGLLLFATQRKIINPIRELIKAQNRLTGSAGKLSGSEIEQLRRSFAVLERHIAENNKEKVNGIALGRYQITDFLASGSMGTVFKGWDPRLERPVALKTIRFGETEGFMKKELVSQLVDEAKIVARVVHPNVVTIYDAVDSEKTAFIAMELIDGISLADFLKRHRALSPNQVTALGIALLRGLGEAHKHKIIHRDIKPGNVLLGYNGSIKVTDFGIAGSVQTKDSDDRVVGSPGYIAPEALDGQIADAVSDIFAVGALLYRCLLGHPAFPGSSVDAILYSTKNIMPKAPHLVDSTIPLALSNIIMYMLQKNPASRPNNATTTADAIEKALGNPHWIPPLSDEKIRIHSTEHDPKTTILADTIVRKLMEKNDNEE